MGLPPKDYVDPGGFNSVTPLPYSGPNGAVGLRPSLPGEGEHYESADGGLSGVLVLPDQVELSKLAKFASSSNFQNFTLAVIVLNGIWIGVDVEWNHPSLKKDGVGALEPMSLVVEHAFCIYFTFEIVTRICAFGQQNIRNGWFVFDFVLVLFMIVETWIMVIIEAIVGGGGDGILSKFSCLRLLRLTRLTRIMTSLPELLMLVRGMINAARSVGIMLCFMVLLMYIFAIVFTANLGKPDAVEHKLDDPYWVRDTDPTSVELFGSMGDSMMSLFTRGLLGDNLAETLQAIKDRAGPWVDGDGDTCVQDGKDDGCQRKGGELWLMWVFILFMIISAFCLLNMLVGVLCEVITQTAETESEENQIKQLRTNIEDAFYAIDTSERPGHEGIADDCITKAEWTEMRTKENVRQCFTRIGVDEDFLDVQLDQIEENLFGPLDKNRMLDSLNTWMPESFEGAEGRKEIPLDKFVQQILEIRPDQSAGHLDLYILKTRAERDEHVFCDQMQRVENLLTRKRTSSNTDRAKQEKQSPDLAIMERNSSPVEAFRSEEPKNGTSSALDPWLTGLSTEVLFAELKHRAAQQTKPNSFLPAMDLN